MSFTGLEQQTKETLKIIYTHPGYNIVLMNWARMEGEELEDCTQECQQEGGLIGTLNWYCRGTTECLASNISKGRSKSHYVGLAPPTVGGLGKKPPVRLWVLWRQLNCPPWPAV